MTSIGNWAFCGCTGLSFVHVPYSVQTIEWDAFEDCPWVIENYIQKWKEGRVFDYKTEDCRRLAEFFDGHGVRREERTFYFASGTNEEGRDVQLLVLPSGGASGDAQGSHISFELSEFLLAKGLSLDLNFVKKYKERIRLIEPDCLSDRNGRHPRYGLIILDE